MAAGAICWLTSGAELYSSRGPTIGGKVKPDISGQDFVSTATYGPFTADPNPAFCGDSGFAGTSAAAPQAAGLAALWWSRHPGWTAKQVSHALRAAAVDLGPPGHDWETGYGRLALP